MPVYDVYDSISPYNQIGSFDGKIENDSFNLYTEQAKAATDPNAKSLYEYLVDAERTHFNLLMLNYESLSSVGSFV